MMDGRSTRQKCAEAYREGFIFGMLLVMTINALVALAFYQIR